ncbi:hypothetical protein BGZ97_002637 [Linnemannia gamsii]|uniref:Uncharacterized protein n=1 Tax=Linnemannia gamsii TaxID=64522 RepID=A0A9P6UTL5_9FUNG|nr:hypothetical protein BGZ97_002637 [Linnemannia gamsii]
MAMVSNSTSRLDSLSKNRISFREDLNDSRNCDNDSDGFYSDDESDNDNDDETSPSNDPETSEIANMERRALKYRKSLTMLNQLVNASSGAGNGDDAGGANGVKQPTKEHLLAAKKSIDDLTAWVNAAALDGDDIFDDDDD